MAPLSLMAMEWRQPQATLLTWTPTNPLTSVGTNRFTLLPSVHQHQEGARDVRAGSSQYRERAMANNASST